MRQKLAIFIVLILLVAVLVGLNAATYVQKEKMPDSEFAPNRSTFNSGATGSQAFYSLLSETGRRVTRWQSPIDALLTEKRNKPTTFVVIGQVRKQFTELEEKQILEWVSNGGRLVLIDREPSERILAALENWNVSVKTRGLEDIFGVDPADQKQMTTDTPAAKPVQPTVFTASVNAVQTSRFASNVEFKWKREWPRTRDEGETSPGTNPELYSADIDEEDNTNELYDFYRDAPPPFAQDSPGTQIEMGDAQIQREAAALNAPVVHLAGGDRNLLVDARYGLGSIVILTDPYIVSNTGLSLVDNARLATNIVSSGGGLIAFDEYHQGYGSNNNRFFQYFAGTPVIAIFIQLAVIAAFVFFSQSRRFARPVPEAEPDRLSKLEYVSAMAELQQRTRAFDLAIENIYTDFRRRTSRLFGVDNMTTGRKVLASLIAERIKGDAREIEILMFECEDVIHGEPTNKKETIRLTARLRELESKLGLQRAGRTKLSR